MDFTGTQSPHAKRLSKSPSFCLRHQRLDTRKFPFPPFPPKRIATLISSLFSFSLKRISCNGCPIGTVPKYRHFVIPNLPDFDFQIAPIQTHRLGQNIPALPANACLITTTRAKKMTTAQLGWLYNLWWG